MVGGTYIAPEALESNPVVERVLAEVPGLSRASSLPPDPWPNSPRARTLATQPKMPAWRQDQEAQKSLREGVCWNCGYDGLRELQIPHDCEADNARREYLR